MARNGNLAPVRADSELVFFHEPTYQYIDPRHPKTVTEQANLFDTASGTIDITGELMRQGEGVITGYVAAAAQDYFQLHRGATRAALGYEEEFPDSPFDIRVPLGDLLSDAMTGYRDVFQTGLQRIQGAIEDGTTIPEDDRPWYKKLVKPVRDF